MKKLLSLALVSVTLGLSVVAQADTFVANTAKNQRGEAVISEYGGFDATRIAASGPSGEEVVCTGKCVLGALYRTTGVAGSRVYLFNTSVAGVSAAGSYVISFTYPTFDSAVGLNKITRSLRFSKGIAVRLDPALAAGQDVTVGTVDLDQR